MSWSCHHTEFPFAWSNGKLEWARGVWELLGRLPFGDSESGKNTNIISSLDTNIVTFMYGRLWCWRWTVQRNSINERRCNKLAVPGMLSATSLLYLVCICNKLTVPGMYLQQAYCTLRLLMQVQIPWKKTFLIPFMKNGTFVTPEGDNYSLYMFILYFINNNYYWKQASHYWHKALRSLTSSYSSCRGYILLMKRSWRTPANMQ